MAKKRKTTKKTATAKRAPFKSVDSMAYIIEDLRPLATPIEDLNEDPRNARKHNKRNLEATMASLSRFKQRKPVVVNRNGNVIEAGNGTYAAAKALGWSHLATVFVDDDETSATGYAIADNRTAELGEWDYETLADLLGEVQDADALIAVDLGFDQGEIDQLLAAEWNPPAPSGDINDFQRSDKTSVSFTADQWGILSQLAEDPKEVPAELVKLAKEALGLDDAE